VRRAAWIACAAAAAASIVVACVVLLTHAPALPAANMRSPETRTGVNGAWIAYSTAPANDPNPRGGYPSGSDVFLVHEGGKPRLVAGRGNGAIWNLCPAFSPNGTMLAFARKRPGGRSIRVVGVAPNGVIVAPTITIEVSVSRLPPCPKWSADGSGLAYLGRNGKLVVRGLDGSIRPRRAGDPVSADFDRSDGALVSPAGDLVAHRSWNSCEVVVSRRDGSRRRVVDDFPCGYAIAGWSPDGRTLLVMKDMDGLHFAMIAVSVDAPFDARPVVVGVRVNHARSWPGYGDVSWQPARRR
jgi:Tol biopolymer transport system component